MRKRRTIYHNDARHYYLWVFDSPIKMEDAWRPIDEVAGTAVDTFSYCVERGDGIFYPSKVGLLFGSDKRPFSSAIAWHAWQSMQSLMDRGLDPLQVLIDRAHDKGMDFFADLRLATYGGMDPAHKVEGGGRGFAEEEVRQRHFAVLRELAEDYPVEGVELDYPAAFGEPPFFFRADEVESGKEIMTEWVAQVADMVRNRPGEPGLVGARVFPSEEMNLAQGLDVRTWLGEGLVDFVLPYHYRYNNLDCDMDIDWVIEKAHQHDVAVYGILQHSIRDESTVHDDRRSLRRIYPSSEMVHAAAANFWNRGVDGLCTWFMKWPLRQQERSVLSEIGDPDLVKERDKRYVFIRRSEEAASLGYDAYLPLELGEESYGELFSLPFYIADDIAGASDRIRQVHLRINISNVVTQDRFTVLLNGESLEDETCLRDYGRRDAPRDQWFEFHLERVRPRRGRNVLEIALDGRPDLLVGGVRIEEVEVYVQYGPHPTGLRAELRESIV